MSILLATILEQHAFIREFLPGGLWGSISPVGMGKNPNLHHLSNINAAQVLLLCNTSESVAELLQAERGAGNRTYSFRILSCTKCKLRQNVKATATDHSNISGFGHDMGEEQHALWDLSSLSSRNCRQFHSNRLPSTVKCSYHVQLKWQHTTL